MKRPESGVTLIELMIAITLVAALSTGMLMAMRTSLLTLQKTNERIQANRRVMSMEQILNRQIGGVMPVTGGCPGPSFRGTPQTLRLVSSFSMTEGSRGYPRILEFQVIPSNAGGLRLIVNEYLYSGPFSLARFCPGDGALIAPVLPQSFVMADRLASCVLSYRESISDSVVSGGWLPAWDRPNLPAAVHIDMTPLAPEPNRLPLVSVTVPIHITKEVTAPYDDRF